MQFNEMKLNFNDIKYLVTECVKKIISERINDKTYHFTSFPSCINILKNNRFNLTMSSNASDAYDNNRLFYLSTQRGRSKDIGYAGHLGSCIRIEINGYEMSQKYSGKPIDYWGNMGKQAYYNPENASIYGTGFTNSKKTHHGFEMEDRIFSHTPTIENASKYISRIDIYLSGQRKDLAEKEKDEAITILILAKRNSIPVFVYNNINDFNFMSKNNINSELEQLYKDNFQSKTKIDYRDYDRYKISDEMRKKYIFVTILEHLLNIYTHGNIFRKDEEMYRTISSVLKEFGLEQYKNDLIKEIKTSYGISVSESCYLLSSTSNAPIRKLSHDYPDDDDAIKIMKLGAYILKKFNVSNFDDLRANLV